MNNSLNYVKQIKNAKRGGYAPTVAKDVNKHRIQKALKLIEQWRQLANDKLTICKQSANNKQTICTQSANNKQTIGT